MEEEKEVGKEVDMGEVPPIGDLLPEQALAPWATLPVAARFWVGGPSDQVARRGPGHQLKGPGSGAYHTGRVAAPG